MLKIGLINCLPLRSQTEIPVPRTIMCDTSAKMVEGVMILQSAIPGVSLATVCDQLAVKEQRAIAWQLGSFLAQLHRIHLRRTADAVDKHIARWSDLLSDNQPAFMD